MCEKEILRQTFLHEKKNFWGNVLFFFLRLICFTYTQFAYSSPVFMTRELAG